MKLMILDGVYCVCRLLPNDPIPKNILQSSFYSISKTKDELSVVCQENLAPSQSKIEKPWSVIQVLGPLEFNLTGILASLTTPLAEEKISLFAISTFDTDYLLVKNKDLEAAKAALQRAQFTFV